MDPAVLGSRIRGARVAARLTQEDLATAMEIPRSAVSELENGHRGVSAAELFAAARHLGQSLDYFVSEEVPPLLPTDEFPVWFRSLELSAEDAAVVRAFEERCRDYIWLEEELEAPHLPSPKREAYLLPRSRQEARQQGERLASEERRRLGLGTDPLQDPFAIVESQGVRLILMPLETQNVSGIAHSSPECGECILVNTRMHQHRRAFDLLHEYAHVLVDGIAGWRAFGSVDVEDDLIERRADAFAKDFLLPGEGVIFYLETRGVRAGEATFLDVFYVMHAFGSSYQATLHRLEELGYLTEHHVRAYRTARNVTEMAARVRKAEGIGQVDLEHPTKRRFGQLVMRALAQNKLSLGRVGELLDLDPVEVRELALLWAATEESDLPLLAG